MSGYEESILRSWVDQIGLESGEIDIEMCRRAAGKALNEIERLRDELYAANTDTANTYVAALNKRSADCAANAGVAPPPCGGIRIPQELPSMMATLSFADSETNVLHELAGLDQESRKRAIAYIKERWMKP